MNRPVISLCLALVACVHACAALLTKRMAESASYQERLDHALEHGTAIPQALAKTKAFLLTAPGVDPQSVEATGVGILYKTTEGLGFYLQVPFERLPGIR